MKKEILVIDDEKDFCYFLKKALEATEEFKVTVSYDGEDGIKKAKELAPDLVLLDVMMPKMGGYEVAEELKKSEETKNIPLVFLTAVVTEREARDEGYLLGGRCFIAKPVKIHELVNKINTTLKS
jgi:DNA-binding response OmpR family regulator